MLTERMSQNKLQIVCRYGGDFVEGLDHKVSYKDGTNRLIYVNPEINYPALLSKLLQVCKFTDIESIKYQYPTLGLDSLRSVENDEDVLYMKEAFSSQRNCPIQLFVSGSKKILPIPDPSNEGSPSLLSAPSDPFQFAAAQLTERMSQNKLQVVCRYGGNFIEGLDHKVSYKDGTNRLIYVNPEIDYPTLLSKLLQVCNFTDIESIKCQYPTLGLDSLRSVENDEDVLYMKEAFSSQRNCPIQLFVSGSQKILPIHDAIPRTIKEAGMGKRPRVLGPKLPLILAQHPIKHACSMLRLTKVIHKLTVQQEDAVRKVGFGGLLFLKATMLRPTLIQWLVSQWDASRGVFVLGGRETPITYREVQLILGLNIDGQCVSSCATYHKTAELRSALGLTDARQITVKPLETIITRGTSDVLFQQAFVLFALASFLCPSGYGKTRDTYLHNVYDIGRCQDFAWGAHVLDVLKAAMTHYNSGERHMLSCCSVLLQFWYYERASQATLGISRGMQALPLLRVWDNDALFAVERELNCVLPSDIDVSTEITGGVERASHHTNVSELAGHGSPRDGGGDSSSRKMTGLDDRQGKAGERMEAECSSNKPLHLQANRSSPSKAPLCSQVNIILSHPEDNIASESKAEMVTIPKIIWDIFQKQHLELRAELSVHKMQHGDSELRIKSLTSQVEALTKINRQLQAQPHTGISVESAIAGAVDANIGDATDIEVCVLEGEVYPGEQNRGDPAEARPQDDDGVHACGVTPRRQGRPRRSGHRRLVSRHVKTPYQPLPKRKRTAQGTKITISATGTDISVKCEKDYGHCIRIDQGLRHRTDCDDAVLAYAFEEASQDDGEILFKADAISISRGVFRSVAPGEWLSTVVMDAYIYLQMRDQQACGAGIVRWYLDSVFVYYMLSQSSTKHHYTLPSFDSPISNSAWVCIPVCSGGHWTTFAVDLVCRRIYFLDSLSVELSSPHLNYVSYLMIALDQIFDAMGDGRDFASFEVVVPDMVPQQVNGVDCGIYAICNATYFTGEGSLVYDPADIDICRMDVAAYILRHKENNVGEDVSKKATIAKVQSQQWP